MAPDRNLVYVREKRNGDCFSAEMIGPTRFLNPGTIGKADKGASRSYAWLTIPPKGMITWQVVRQF